MTPDPIEAWKALMRRQVRNVLTDEWIVTGEALVAEVERLRAALVRVSMLGDGVVGKVARDAVVR